MSRTTMLKLFQMGSKGGHASDAVQVSPPAQGGPGGGGKSQAGKAEVNNPNQYGKPATLGPQKGNMKTPKFEDIVANVKAVSEGKKSPVEAVLALYFEGEEDPDVEEAKSKKKKKKGDDDDEDDDDEDDDEDESTDEKAALGQGGRFKALKKKLAARGAKSPGALAAYIGRKKYGKKRFQKLSAKGRKEDVGESTPEPGNPAVATAKGTNAGQAPTPTVGGPQAGELMTFSPAGSGDATKMGTYESQLRKWLDDALSQKKLWVAGIFIHKNGPNEFYLDGIASGTVSLDAAVKACVQFGDRKLAPPGAPTDDLK
jgi:hypothetical protein